ncbi:MAG: Fe-S cluster assembly ATPase SufC [Bacteriovoracaceae bacterium]|nr:Fe-S cluster assembly ATPase SufC [Bacteriovoracaceae bacterium]
MIEIKNLTAKVDGNEILKGINLVVKKGEVHAIMGPNGSGKSTLSKIIAGHPAYEVTGGEINYEINGKMKNLLDLDPSERAKEGIFLGFQYPIEVPGVSNFTFLKESFNQICEHQGLDKMDDEAFLKHLRGKLKLLEMNESFLERSVNEGFSGGEKKKNEILQMAILNPRLSLLDETDSGLDIDALKIVANGVNALKSRFNATILVTHYQRLLDYIVPDYVHVLYKGQIIKSGDKSLALELEEKGYDWLIKG